MKMALVVERVLIGMVLGVASSALVLGPHNDLSLVTFGAVETVVILACCAVSTLFAFSLESDMDLE